MGKHLALIGGGHAHLTTLLKLADFVKRGHRVTLISPSPYHYYSGMGPGLLAGTYEPRDTRFHIRRMAEARGARFVQDRVTAIEAARRTLRLQSGEQISYDVASFNVGSAIDGPSGSEEGPWLVPAKPIENLYHAREAIRARRDRPLRLVVVGGGAAGVEIAGNLWRLAQSCGARAEIFLIAGGGLLAQLPIRARELARRSLTHRGISVLEDERASALSTGAVQLASGSHLSCDLCFLASGVKPPPLFRQAGLAGPEDDGLLVGDCLQSIADPRIFGGGDCISLIGEQLPRVGVHAVRQNPVLRRNLLAALEERSLHSFRPQKKFLLILNLGDDTGIACRGMFTGSGSGVLHLKHWIDRRFMQRFQVSGEARETRAVA
ncbi:FAD-dependent oxidoreductase [Geoalkalibacter sp.]|uniref:FAD-dependent oxidoreductase n=1 Tax=Geoalkalibacter sp. TaxID=3041440 RepID=UPI00272E60F6|nr:FAD-dependent oxidoreductase [Geoalkalibacter sp.]